ncbi:MAG: DUF1573 domain-containing protein [Bacteroidota bacterium]
MLKSFKNVLFALAAVAFIASCQNQSNDVRDAARNAVSQQQPAPANNSIQNAVQAPSVPTGPTTVMSFGETTFDFGTVTEGEKVAHTYTFTNSGNEPLILSNARGSCGCTVPKWPRQPIQPGESSEIVVEFNTKNKQGARNQKVTITANTNPPETFIYLKGQVEKSATSPAVQVN